jgi:SAM-dependent methyltransferase
VQSESPDQMPTPEEAAVRAELSVLLFGFMRTQAISVAANLGIADLIGDEPRDVSELAHESGAHEPSLYRLLRLLTSEGVFEEREPRRFANNRLSEGLRSSAPSSMRYIAISMGMEMYRSWTSALHSFKTGEPGFDEQFGLPWFDYLAQHSEASDVFNRAMAAGTRTRLEALVRHDWAPFRRVADIGGGTGSTIAAVLAANPQLEGALFDLPGVVAGAAEILERAGVAARCAVFGGDFFDDPLPPADAYLLVQILHDWGDERAAAILRNCRRSIATDGRLLIVDGVVAPGSAADPLKHMDLHMLVMLGGKERSEEEWRELLSGEAFDVVRIAPSGAKHMIEARPV